MEIVHDNIDLQFPPKLRPSHINHDVPLDDLLEIIIPEDDDIPIHIHMIISGISKTVEVAGDSGFIRVVIPPIAHNASVESVVVDDEGLHILVDTTNPIGYLWTENIHLASGEWDDGFCYVVNGEIYENFDDLPKGEIWQIQNIYLAEAQETNNIPITPKYKF